MKPKRIVKLREALGLTQRQFAEKIGAHQPTVARWETGKNQPRGANLKALMQLEEKVKKKKAQATGYWQPSKEKQKEVLQMLNQQADELFVNLLVKSMTSKELSAWGAKNLPQIFKTSALPLMGKDLKESFNRMLNQKKRSELKGIKGNKYVEKKEDGTLKGKFDLYTELHKPAVGNLS